MSIPSGKLHTIFSWRTRISLDPNVSHSADIILRRESKLKKTYLAKWNKVSKSSTVSTKQEVAFRVSFSN